jgi:hypothetical protein
MITKEPPYSIATVVALRLQMSDMAQIVRAAFHASLPDEEAVELEPTAWVAVPTFYRWPDPNEKP